jgi:sterol desaturase/sphingolipid hydroxylase (fatty acid hydroxylase superfamily)
VSRPAELVSCEVSINAMPWTNSRSVTYWILFVGAFLAVAVWESFSPRRTLSGPAERRWGRHAVLLAVSTLFQKVILQVNPVIVAALVANSRIGILNRPWLPFAVRCAATVLLLDLARYLIHRTYHAVGFLWRIHEVHHSDPDYDVSTAGRFHPLEVLVDQGSILATIALLAPPVSAVFAAELVTLLLNFFVHANASLPGAVDQALRAVIVTPDMHRIHHSEQMEEQWRNLGQTFSWWDRLLGTYRGNPAAGDKGLVTGVKGLQNAGSIELGFMLAEPFRSRSESAVT